MLLTAAACSGAAAPPTGGTAVTAPDRAVTTGAPSGAETAVGFWVVGDSLTAGARSVIGDALPGVGSWVTTADVLPAEFRGGWAVPGATTADMLAGVAGRDLGEVVDVVVLAGTNDVGNGVAPEVSISNVEAIVETVRAINVLLVAIPPFDAAPAEAESLNEALTGLASARGWAFIDPWLDVRNGGTYLAGSSSDGVHPTHEVADVVGHRIRDALLDLDD